MHGMNTKIIKKVSFDVATIFSFIKRYMFRPLRFVIKYEKNKKNSQYKYWTPIETKSQKVIPNFECRNEPITSRLTELSQPQYAHYFDVGSTEVSSLVIIITSK